MPNSDAELQDYLNQPLAELMEELAIYRDAATGGATRGVSDVWRQIEPLLRERVCAEWNWCVRRQDARTDEPLTIATLLVSIIAPVVMQWQVPAALVAVILVKRGLDAFCDCPPIGQS